MSDTTDATDATGAAADAEPTALTDANCVTCPACAALVSTANQATHFAWHWDMENRLRDTGPRRATPSGPPPQRFGPHFPPGAVPPTSTIPQ